MIISHLLWVGVDADSRGPHPYYHILLELMLLHLPSNSTKKVSSTISVAQKLTMPSSSSATEKKAQLPTGSSKTHGDQTGVNLATSECIETCQRTMRASVEFNRLLAIQSFESE